jgi:uncharacterized repeat protein (TIGR01451 family)
MTFEAGLDAMAFRRLANGRLSMKINFITIAVWVCLAVVLAGCTAQRKPVVAHPAVIPAAPPVVAPPPRKASLELSRTAPTDALVCDAIPVTLSVTNNGGKSLTGVKITDVLPKGWTRDDAGGLIFDAGGLAPGEGRTFTYNVHAASAGKFTGRAKATAMENVSDDAATVTAVHQAVFVSAGQTPATQMFGRKFSVSFVITNIGDVAADAVFSLPVPSGLIVSSLADNGQFNDGVIRWKLGSVDVQTPQTVSVEFIGNTAGEYAFNGSVKGDCTVEIAAACRTKITGVAAISLQKNDSPDPIAVGEITTFTIKITNPGSAADSNLALSVDLAPELQPVGSDNPNAIIHDRTVTFPVVSLLPAHQSIVCAIVARGVKAGDAHTQFNLNSTALKSPLVAQESTTVY